MKKELDFIKRNNLENEIEIAYKCIKKIHGDLKTSLEYNKECEIEWIDILIHYRYENELSDDQINEVLNKEEKLYELFEETVGLDKLDKISKINFYLEIIEI